MDTSIYRFGFNGIHKENEVAGIGNHYSAFFGEYDPRRVGRWNIDPKPVAWESAYSMFRGNPIINSDPLLDSAWYKSKDGGLHFDARINSQKDMKKLGLKGTYIGAEAYGQTKGKNAMGLYGDKQGRLSVLLPEAEIKDKRDAWKAAYDLGYMPAQGPDGIGLHGNLGANGITANGGGGIGLYADKNLNAGGFVSAAGGAGASTPGFSASLGLDFYSYGGRVNPSEFVGGTSIANSLQLGILSFTVTNATNAKIPLQSNGGLTIYSIDFGLKGFGFTSKLGLTKYVGTKEKE